LTAPALTLLWLILALLPSALAQAQSTGATERKLDRAKRELDDVAAQRRRIESHRGAATRELRAVDERVGAATRGLRQADATLTAQQAELTQLQQRRRELDQHLTTQRQELARLLRSAYVIGDAAPLKVLLSQDTLAAGQRLLAYHGYLQRDRAARIGTLRQELTDLAAVEQRIALSKTQLARARARRQLELERLARERKNREQTVAQLDRDYDDRRRRERALGRDVKGLEAVLAQLRAAARKAEAERRAAAAARSDRPAKPARAPDALPTRIANAQPLRVGGLGWPLSGNLIAAYGGTLPDGRRSQGVLIGAPAGTAVHAVANGKVVFAEWMSGYGLLCIIDHGDGTMSLYANNDGLLREVGTDVARGDAIASVGNSGGQGIPALYFELRRNGRPVDPGTWLGKR